MPRTSWLAGTKPGLLALHSSKPIITGNLHGMFLACCWICFAVLFQGCESSSNSNSPLKPEAQSKVQTLPAAAQPQTINPDDFEKELSYASKLLAEKKTQEAWDAVKKLSVVRPQDPQLLYLSALVLAAKDDLPGAIQTIVRIPADVPQAIPAAGQAAEWMATLGKLPEAEAELMKIIKQYPTAVPAIRLLAKIYNAQGRRFEASRYLDRLVRLGDFTRTELLGTVDPRDYFDEETLRNAFAQAYPDHPYVTFARIIPSCSNPGYGQQQVYYRRID
jgi:tetratricopeptide (TPR) repeat protein